MTELVLQPNVGEDFVRRWLLEAGYGVLRQKCILEEDGHIYEILHARVSAQDADGTSNQALYHTSDYQLRLTDAANRNGSTEWDPICCSSRQNYGLRNGSMRLASWQRICEQLSRSELDESAHEA